MTLLSRELSREQRVRYARQISLPEIGEAGQLRLADTRVESSHPVATLYLERAGLDVVEMAVEKPGASRGINVQPAVPELREAAELLSGALTAVEAIKTALGIGTALTLPDDFQLGQEHSS